MQGCFQMSKEKGVGENYQGKKENLSFKIFSFAPKKLFFFDIYLSRFSEVVGEITKKLLLYFTLFSILSVTKKSAKSKIP